MKTTAQIVILIAISILAGFGFNAFREQPLPVLYETIRLESGSYMDLAQAATLHKQRQALFIDARTPDAFQKGHIAGSLNLSVKWSRSKKMELLDPIPKDANIIVYCDDARCTSAGRLAGEMQFMGYAHVAVFSDGWDAWQKMNASGK